MKRGAACFAAALFLPLLAPAQDAASRPESLPTSAALEKRLEEIRAKHGVPALGAAVTTGEKLLAIGVTGLRCKDKPERVTVNDRWHLGSCTKSMTATVLARLVEQGKLRFETTIGEVFKDSVKDMNADWRPVTIEQLLAHRAGVPADLSKDRLWPRLWERKGTLRDQRRMLLEGVLKWEPTSKPAGTEYLYSNAGYAVAGHMAEELTGKAWEDITRAELFEPLGMKSAGFGAPGSASAIDEPWGHSGNECHPAEPGPMADNPPAIAPAGTVHATLADWAKYAAVHLRGARGKTDYLKPETFARLQARPAVGDYAFGWGHHAREWANGHVLQHTGSNTMWFCVIWLAPERDAAFLAVCNAGGDAAARATDRAVVALIEAVNFQVVSTSPPLKK